MPKRQTSFNPEWIQKSTHLYQKAVETLFMDFAHCVTVKWTLVVKGKPPLTDKPARKTHKSNRRAAGTSSLGSFFEKQHHLRMTKSSLFFAFVICLIMDFYYFQKCYVFRHCALCKTGSSQWSVFETDITMSWINTNTVNKYFFASSATHRSTSRYIVYQTVWQWIE